MVHARCPCCCGGLWVINGRANMAEHLLWRAPPVIWVGNPLDLSTNTRREETVGWKLVKVGGWLCWKYEQVETVRWSVRGGQIDDSRAHSPMQSAEFTITGEENSVSFGK